MMKEKGGSGREKEEREILKKKKRKGKTSKTDRGGPMCVLKERKNMHSSIKYWVTRHVGRQILCRISCFKMQSNKSNSTHTLEEKPHPNKNLHTNAHTRLTYKAKSRNNLNI